MLRRGVISAPVQHLNLPRPATTFIGCATSKFTGSSGAVRANGLLLGVTVYQAFNETVVSSIRWIELPSPVTSGCTSISPSANNQYLEDSYALNALVSLCAIPSTGSAFVGWSQGQTGTASSETQAVANQRYASAKFNVTDTTAPLRVTGFTHANAVVTATASTMTLNGAGFTNNGLVCVRIDANCRASAVLTRPQLPEELQAGYIAVMAYGRVGVLNNEATRRGTYAQSVCAVPTKADAALLMISKTHAGNCRQRQQGAATDTVRGRMALVWMSGKGWTSESGGDTCARGDVLDAGFPYPTIAVTVNAAPDAVVPPVKRASILGGGPATSAVKNATIVSW